MNIIEKTMITKGTVIPTVVVGVITCSILIGLLVYMFVKHDPDTVLKYLMPVMLFGIIGIVVGTCIGCLIRIPTDRYKYKATLDNTVSANELFENYENITYENGVYTFEDKEEEQ